MTREEELDWLCRLRSEIYVYMPKEWLIPMNNALDMVIKDLEQEPTTKNDLGVDCISREGVERIINKWLSHSDYELKDHIYSMTKKIHNLPSVTPIRPKGHWILTDVEGNRVWRCNCSECGKDPQDYVGGSENWWLIKSKLPKFCPRCGSDNSEGEE